MARDYKRAAQKKRKKKSIPGWLYFFTGLSVGLFATMLVYLQMSSDQKVVTKTQTEAEKSQSAAAVFEKALAEARAQLLAAAKKAKDSVATSTKSTEESTADDESEGGAVESSGLRFDFYTILPELEVVIPDSELLGSSKKIIDKSVEVSKRGKFILQTGSFKTKKQAERRKAKLAMLGVSSSIQRVTINDKEIWYRVRVGPTEDFKQLDKIRTLLFKNNITAIALSVKPGK